MTDIDLDAITQRAEAATPGPWEFQHWGEQNQNGDYAESILFDGLGESLTYGLPDADGEFIANARADVPALVVEVRRLSAERDALARWKAEALPVMAAFLDLARRVVPESALGRFLPDALAEHIDRQAAALREIGALADEAPSVPVHVGGGNLVDRRRLVSADDLLAILARHSGGRAE